MSGNPFERFERSRRGLLIPVVLFVVGACLTYAAITSLRDVFLREIEAVQKLQSEETEADLDAARSRVVGDPGNQNETEEASQQIAVSEGSDASVSGMRQKITDGDTAETVDAESEQ